MHIQIYICAYATYGFKNNDDDEYMEKCASRQVDK